MLSPAQGRRQRAALLKEIARDHRAAQRRKLAELRAQIAEAKSTRARTLAEAKHRCKAARLAIRASLKDERKRLLATLAERRASARAAARASCDVELSQARAHGSRAARARAELAAERAFASEMKTIDRLHRERSRAATKSRSARGAKRSESDDEVRASIPPEFLVLFERVKGKIRGGDRMTRTEAFLQYAHDHPGEYLEALEDKTDALVRELEAKQAAHRRGIKKAPSRRALEQFAEQRASGSDIPF